MDFQAKHRFVRCAHGILLAVAMTAFVFSSGGHGAYTRQPLLTRRAKIESYFVRIAEYVDQHKYRLSLVYNNSIYQGAYLMRILVAAYEISGRPEFLSRAVSFSDEFVELQRDDGYWVVADHGHIFLPIRGVLYAC